MAKLTLPFAGIARDMPNYAKPGMQTVKNLIPLPGNALGPYRQLSPLSAAIDTLRVNTLMSAQSSGGLYYVYAGTRSKLLEGDSAWTFTDQSDGGGYNLGLGDSWEIFAFERSRKVIAINGASAIKSLTIGAGASANFATMITSTEKPNARHGAIIGQFVVLGRVTSTADGYRSTRIHWSAFGDETDFQPSAATQCDYEDLANGGQVNKIVGGNEYGVVFQEEMVRTLRYVGGQTIFDIRPINYAPGTSIPRSVVAHEGVIYYISPIGFIALDGLNPKRIGADKVDSYFFSTFFNSGNADNYVSAAPDAQRKIIWWAYPTTSSSFADKMLGYKYDEGRWVEWVPEQNIETLAFIRNSIFDPILVAAGVDHKVSSFTASTTLPGVIETGAIQPVPGRRWQLNNVRVIGDNQGAGLAADINVSVRPMNRPDDATMASYSTAVPRNVHGLNPVRIAGNYLQLQCSISVSPTGSTARYQGLELDYELLGDR
jgi:hypothetical protein